MANPMRGEAELGDYKLVVNFNGFCTLEGETGLKVPQLISRLETGLGFADLRTWIWVFIDADMTREQVGDLIGELTPDPVLKALAKAIDGFFSVKKAKAPNPPKAE